MAEKKFTATLLGAAKADSKVFKRGYTINLVPGKPAAEPAEKTAQKPAKKKGK